MLCKTQHTSKSVYGLLLAESYSQFITSSRVTPRGGRRHTAGQCHVIPTDAHIHCWWIHTAQNGQSCTHGLNEGKFDCTKTVFRDYFCSPSSVNPPGCHRLHKPIVGKIIGPHTCMHFSLCRPHFFQHILGGPTIIFQQT